jgi:hypothetical protein
MILNMIICIYAKYSIITIITIISNYPIFNLILKYYFNNGISSLNTEFSLPLKMNEMLFVIIIYNLMTLIFIFFTRFLEEERDS